MQKIHNLIEKLCPNGVEYKTIGELFDVKNGYTPLKNNKYFWENGNIPWFRMDDIRTNGNILNDAIQHITELAIKNRKFPKDSLIVATTATIGVHALIKCDFVCNQQLTCVAIKEKFKNDLNIKFCFYYFDIIDEQCKKIANQGGGMPIVSLEKMKKLVFPVPPMEVQCEIVRILDKLTRLETELETELEAELEARKKQYKFYLHRLLEVKEGVELTIGEIYDFKYGTGNTIPSEGGKYPVYGSNGKVGYCKEYNSEDAPVIGHIGAYAGIVNWAEGKHFVTYNGVICKYKNKMVNKRYAYYLLLTQDFIGEQKGAQPFVSYDALRKPVVRIPNIEIQKSIVEKLDKLDKLCNDISECLPAEIETRQKQYEYYRDKLLTFKELKVNE